MRTLTVEQKIYYTLRIAVAMCFLGHGLFGLITKSIWCNYFAVFGIGHDVAYRLMPLVGAVDICLGIVMLAYPVRAIAAWLVIWGIITALLRPLSGEPLAEFIERAGNFGAPLALLMITGSAATLKGWFTKIDSLKKADCFNLAKLLFLLRMIGFLLLLGHGWLNLVEKNSLINQYAALGFSNPVTISHLIGIAEVFAAFAVVFSRVRPVLLILFVWKITSELFYPHYELVEWIERGGSYGVLLALWFAFGKHTTTEPVINNVRGPGAMNELAISI
ncbi:MAG: hypothetical protein M3040_14450 [Bacteroidota bacterium]|nr:hypothetical protein [Bacteroidota bacterium]